MDELIHHCLRELAFDGDLGSDVLRLKDFIVDFYSHENSSHAQNPDDAFCSFVWGIVVQQPTVVVGLVPEDITTEVWIAPQTSARRKAQARGEDPVEQQPPKLDSIPEPKTTSLETLLHAYGNKLRLAVESDAIFAAITGSHIRSSKMSPMVYSALQIITRGRDAGVTVVELGKQSGYDQKTCFYLIKQLIELELVVKVRRGGVGTHFCIHKYFFDRSSSWKAIRDEELQAESFQVKNQGSEVDFGEEDEDIADSEALSFTPIDARHLSSLPLISARVIRLLKASKNHMHASNNMLITLGFSNPTKTDRRFFQSRIREMIQQRLIEKVVVLGNRKNSVGTSVKCFRLIKQDPSTPVETGLVLSDPDDEMGDIAFAQNGVKLNTTIHKQIIDHLEESGTSGMTLNELSASLCQFDKRTIELLLARADKYHPPSHLSDLRIASLMETSGRERRHRYFTAANFCRLVVQEELDKTSSGYNDVDLKNVGGFLPVVPQLFYATEEELIQYSDTFKDADRARPTKPKKKKIPKNPILPNGKVKRGRPRKIVNDEEDGSASVNLRKNKRKREDADVASFESLEKSSKKARTVTEPVEPPERGVVKRGRGRPRKVVDQISTAANDEPMPETQTLEDLSAEVVTEPPQPSGQEQAPSRDAGRSSLEEINRNGASPMVCVEPPAQKLQNVQSPTPINVDTEEQIDAHILPSTISNRIPEPVGESVSTIPDVSEIGTGDISPTMLPNPSGETVPTESGADAALCTQQDTSDISDPLTNVQGESSLSTKQSVSSQNSRINVSQLRRENELLRLVENAGGIVNIQAKEFYTSHMKLLEIMARAGEPTSAPVGTKTDKRTMTTTFSRLESKGRVKQLRTSVTTHTGVNRPACIIYLPNIEQSKINAFLADLAKVSSTPASHLNSFVKIDEKLDYGGELSSNYRGIAPLQLLQIEQPGMDEKERWGKNLSRAQQLFNQDEASTRDKLLTEKSTIAQKFGFIVGKALRCRELHLTIARALEEGTDSPNIVSHEKKIVDMSFFCLDLPIQLYCALVSPLHFDEELHSLLAIPDGQMTLVRDLSPSLRSSLQIGRSRARSRILSMLELLFSLNLATPLQPSTSANPYIICPQKGDHPNSFEVASLDRWTAPTAAPIYWHFHDTAPIHLYAKSEDQAPFWKMVDTSSVAGVKVYWNDLQNACLDPKIEPDIDDLGPSHVSTASVSAARSLRRTTSWKSDYLLTSDQMQYLKSFIDMASMSTPLQIVDEFERETQLERIGQTISAPSSVVENYFSSAREKLLRNSERIKERARRTEKRTEEAKLSLAKKAEEARTHKEQEWSSLLARIHPDTLMGPAAVRIEKTRTQFLQSGSTKDVSKWEKEIQSALHEADLANSKALKIQIHAKRLAPPKQVLLIPPSAHIPPESSIRNLIESQGPPLQQPSELEKKKRKRDSTSKLADSNVPRKITRRHRFHWNPEFDELARDASAIIRARCRSQSRLDWAAFEQVFPSVPRNTVRQRLSHIKETPGNEAYLRRLEDAWYDIWVKFRGTEALPDDDPDSPSKFDLVKHVEFLRSHVDKNSIRVGFAHATESAGVILPADVQALEESFSVVQAEKTAPDWDFMWNALIEEGREKKLKKLVISRCPEEFPVVHPSEINEVVLAEATLKIVMGTPPERYDPALASSLLKRRGEGVIDTATRNLLSRGILSKSQRDPMKQKPGRQLKISEVNQNAMGGSITRDTFQDALSLLEEIDPTDTTWHDWPLTATDGDCATLIELVSEDKVDFNIDTSLPQAARPALDWNSKKADDDQIETGIAVRYKLDASSQIVALDEPQPIGSAVFSDSNNAEPLEALAVETGHGRDVENNPACCKKLTSRGCVDCAACLNDAWAVLSGTLHQERQETAHWILNMTLNARESGIRKIDLSEDSTSNSRLAIVVNLMTENDIPLLYWMGYSSIVLVSAQYVSKWSVAVSDDPLINVLPRRWLDIQGIKVADFWRSALRAVMGLVVFRPGITQAEIRWRLRAAYDRQEVNEVLRYLLKEGHLRLCVGFSSAWTSCGTGMPFDESEERKVFWFVGEKHWYQV